jgi:hypothetical protein
MPRRKLGQAATRKKPVRISVDTVLLRRIDADSEARAAGRSAFISSAVVWYLRDKESARIDARFRTALGGKADEVLAELDPFLAGQVWDEEVGETPGPVVRRRRSAR